MPIPSLRFFICKIGSDSRYLRGFLLVSNGMMLEEVPAVCQAHSWRSVRTLPSACSCASRGECAPGGQRCVLSLLTPPCVPAAVSSVSPCLRRVTRRKGQPDTESKPGAPGKAVGVSTLMSGSKVLTPRKDRKGQKPGLLSGRPAMASFPFAPPESGPIEI